MSLSRGMVKYSSGEEKGVHIYYKPLFIDMFGGWCWFGSGNRATKAIN